MEGFVAYSLEERQCQPYIKWPAPEALRIRNLTPWRISDLCKAYNFPTGLSGGGVIGIVELGGGWVQSDLDKFSQLNGLPQIQVEDVSADGTRNDLTQDPSANGEVALDIQVAVAAYFYATGHLPVVKVLWARDIAPGVLAAVNAGCDVCSISWGADEARWAQMPGSTQAMEAAALHAVQNGCVVFAASGDNSSGDGDWGANVDLPAACPHVIGCGGTSKSHAAEEVWGRRFRNDGQGTGGGFSRVFPNQSWQTGAPTSRGRMVPDVAGNADPSSGYLIVVNDKEVQIGGTSAVAPLYSGLFASFGKKLGFVTPKLFSDRSGFTDITVGSNGAFRAGAGPDPCTGLGVPNGQQLAKLLIQQSPSSDPPAPGSDQPIVLL